MLVGGWYFTLILPLCDYILCYVNNFMNTSQMRFHIPFLPEELITNRATKLRWNVIATHCMFLQMMFKFE
jgi:hypothetical protein